MDAAAINPNQNYDEFIKKNNVLDIADIEAKQLSGKNNVIHKEITPDELIK